MFLYPSKLLFSYILALDPSKDLYSVLKEDSLMISFLVKFMHKLNTPSIKKLTKKLTVRIFEIPFILLAFAVVNISASERHAKKSELPNPCSKNSKAPPSKAKIILLETTRTRNLAIFKT